MAMIIVPPLIQHALEVMCLPQRQQSTCFDLQAEVTRHIMYRSSGLPSLFRHSLIRQNYTNELIPIVKLPINPPIRQPPSAKMVSIQTY